MSKVIVSHHEASHGSVKTYATGFALSIILTLAAYTLVAKGITSGWALVFILAALAISQLLVQLVFFLHLGRESKPRWNLTVMAFAAMVVIILVFGSLWIMKNLQYNHAKVPSTEQIIKDEGYGPSNE